MKYFSTRRRFLQNGAAASAGIAATSFLGLATPAHAYLRHEVPAFGEVLQDDDAITRDPRVKKLLQQSVDAAISAGASYADMRLTHTRKRSFRPLPGSGGRNVTDDEEISIGIRAFVRGYWGFASGPVWTLAEGTRLGKEAVHQATTNALGKDRIATLAPAEKVSNGNWTMPVKIDPFSIHPSQIGDILLGICNYGLWQTGVFGVGIQADFQRQDKAFCSSDGTYFSQRTYLTSGLCQIAMYGGHSGGLDIFSPAGVGFEMFDETTVRQAIDQCLIDLKANAALPIIPIDVGRYETVMDALSIANLLSGCIGAATELDRALGFEANAGGTSYLNDPANILGHEVVGSRLLSVTANRSDPGGAATVQWDDEGVTPKSTSLVTNGLVSGYQTTREGAGWLGRVTSGSVASSTGCAHAPAGVDAPLTHTANLRMEANPASNDFNTLINSVKKGIACQGVGAWLDFQQLNGMGYGAMFQIANGKKVARIINGGILFRSPELWKSLRAIGGDFSRRAYGMNAEKGEPPQNGHHTVSAVPAAFETLTFIDITRKA